MTVRLLAAGSKSRESQSWETKRWIHWFKKIVLCLDCLTYIFQIVIGGAFYPNYFLRKVSSETDAIRELSNNDPMSTVVVCIAFLFCNKQLCFVQGTTLSKIWNTSNSVWHSLNHISFRCWYLLLTYSCYSICCLPNKIFYFLKRQTLLQMMCVKSMKVHVTPNCHMIKNHLLQCVSLFCRLSLIWNNAVTICSELK